MTRYKKYFFAYECTADCLACRAAEHTREGRSQLPTRGGGWASITASAIQHAGRPAHFFRAMSRSRAARTPGTVRGTEPHVADAVIEALFSLPKPSDVGQTSRSHRTSW